MSPNKMKVLAGRTVIFFPDVDGYREWTERTKALTFCRSVTVSDLLEKNATEEDRIAKIDIADLLLCQWEKDRRMAENPPLVEAERMLQEMVKRNPALQTLIDTLGLVPVVDDG